MYFLIFQNNCLSKDMLLDQLKNPNLTTQSQEWNFISDQVMGGVSSGKFEVEEIESIKFFDVLTQISKEDIIEVIANFEQQKIKT